MKGSCKPEIRKEIIASGPGHLLVLSKLKISCGSAGPCCNRNWFSRIVWLLTSEKCCLGNESSYMIYCSEAQYVRVLLQWAWKWELLRVTDQAEKDPVIRGCMAEETSV